MLLLFFCGTGGGIRTRSCTGLKPVASTNCATPAFETMVLTEGFEPAGCQDLSLVRLPIAPRQHQFRLLVYFCKHIECLFNTFRNNILQTIFYDDEQRSHHEIHLPTFTYQFSLAVSSAHRQTVHLLIVVRHHTEKHLFLDSAGIKDLFPQTTLAFPIFVNTCIHLL